MKDIGVRLLINANARTVHLGTEIPVKLLVKMDKSLSTVNASARKRPTGQATDALPVDLAKCGMDLHVLISCALQDRSGTVQDAALETNALQTIISMD